ncbi:hypothetical protein [Nocardia sp. NPDC052566]|uniref:hypothetical protein n=1 Tax=Nocardia sp. NPDC052566 TaxID=3364330 RepID=UPI0037CBD47E
MTMWDYQPKNLSWADVDPATHTFDVVAATALVSSLPPPHYSNREHWVVSVSRALGEQFGVWTYGWAWGRDESDFGGGPVSAWCCVDDSVGEPQETVERTLRALVEWRAWLERLATRFDTLTLPDGPAEKRISAWEHAVPALVNEVVAQTDAGDAWYQHAEQVLGWFLQRAGVPADRAAGLIDEAIGGRFQSWISPAESVVVSVAERLAAGLADAGA